MSVGPEQGHRFHAWERKLAKPESLPCQNGEFDEMASRVGSHTRMRSSTATPSDSDSTETCT
jgi:hypothetical protein